MQAEVGIVRIATVLPENESDPERIGIWKVRIDSSSLCGRR